MRTTPSGTYFSATDLAAYLECAHKTALDLRAAEGTLERPGQSELERRLLELRGGEHERRVLDHYRKSGKNVVMIGSQPGAEGSARASELTLEAMSNGADVIHQGALADGVWSGRPDFLIKVGGGERWAHHYEVVDAKLAREARARAVLQLCVYTDHLAKIQQFPPEYFHIAPGGGNGTPISLRVDDYMSYYRAIRGRFEGFVAEGAQAPYPEPVEHCGVCAWWKRCEERRRTDDHLSLVAGITRRQRDRLASSGIARVSELAVLDPNRGLDGIARESLARVREQARLQVRGREQGRALYELLTEWDDGCGLEALPKPTPGDLFFDLEGDAFVNGDGLEYLFGLVDFGEPDPDGFIGRDAPGPARYFPRWALDRVAEKQAFERVIDRIVQGREEFADLHVYHFGHREADALKKLSCRYATREEEVDQLLRDHVLVDLYPIVRHSLRASVESYTLKALEALHGFARAADLRDAARAMHHMVWWLETADPDLDPKTLQSRIEAYNREDCLSTSRLRDWLELRRVELSQLTGKALARPRSSSENEKQERNERGEAAAALAKRLLAGTPDASRRLMADLLDWHWREAKSGWWEYYRGRELPAEDRLADRAVLAGLEYQGVVATAKQSNVHRYTFPEQEHAIRKRPDPIDPDTEKSAGKPVAIEATYIDLSRSKRSTVPHPRALIAGKPMATEAHQRSLLALAEAIASDGAGFAAARELLSRAAPSVGQAPRAALVRPGEPIEAALQRLTAALDGSVLAVQGPPGSGKTYQASLLVLDLLAAGKRVGVTANSHSVIKNLLGKIAERDQKGVARILHLQDEDGDSAEKVAFEIDNDKAKAVRRLAAGDLNLVGGTSWTWAHEQFAGSLDVLVIDEAGQMSLANVLAVSRAAKNLVLFGDPAQLEQPQKGTHPTGADASALEHLLGPEDRTLAPERGVFIPKTRRLHPEICDFISKVFYDGRLEPAPDLGLERQHVSGPGVFSGAGLRFVAVSHWGNTNHSPEEVAEIKSLVSELLASGATFTDRESQIQPITENSILVVAPYNSQVAALKRVLPKDVRVGTVDKFQGREAPVVIYSMTSSSAEDAPRGLEFLYSLNRLNVAISRAQALAVLVASPELSRAACKTPRQMKLVNALCGYLQMASRPGA